MPDIFMGLEANTVSELREAARALNQNAVSTLEREPALQLRLPETESESSTSDQEEISLHFSPRLAQRRNAVPNIIQTIDSNALHRLMERMNTNISQINGCSNFAHKQPDCTS